MGISIDISEDVANSLKIPESELESRLKTELAVRLYRKGLASFGKARKLADLSVWEFSELLAKEGISRKYGVKEFEEDLKTLEELG